MEKLSELSRTTSFHASDCRMNLDIIHALPDRYWDPQKAPRPSHQGKYRKALALVLPRSDAIPLSLTPLKDPF